MTAAAVDLRGRAARWGMGCAVLVALCVAVGLYLRMKGLAAEGFGDDEVHKWLAAQRYLRGDLGGDDVEHPMLMKALIALSALVFGVQLQLQDVARRGLSALTQGEFETALASGSRVRELVELEPHAGHSAVQARPISADDPFFAIDGTTNVIRLEVDPMGEIAISGPGAGRALAGQGVFSDLIALGRERATRYG